MNNILTTKKRKRLNREGWETTGALRELRELSRVEILANAAVYIPSISVKW